MSHKRIARPEASADSGEPCTAYRSAAGAAEGGLTHAAPAPRSHAGARPGTHPDWVLPSVE